MQPFFSLPKKIVLLLIALLLALSTSMSFLWLNKTNQDFQLKQQEIRQQNQKQYLLLNQIFRVRLESWVEFFVQVHQNQQDPLISISDTLNSRFEFLELHWQVENLWLFDQQHQLVYSSGQSVPDYIRNLTTEVMQKQYSIEKTYCDDKCSQILGIPILLGSGETAILSISYSLVETLAFLNQSTDATLALVHTPGEPSSMKANNLYLRGPVARSVQEFIASVIASFPQDLSVQTLSRQGIQVRVADKQYFVLMIPITTVNQDFDYVLSAHDVTPVIKTHESYQRTIIITAVFVFVVAILLFYLMTNSVRQRLIRLASQLPLLAQRDYQEFHKRGIDTKHLFRDELDTLSDSANDLAIQLAMLDEQVLAKTSELENIAMYDQLTQLPNRNMLTKELTQALSNLKTQPGLVVVLFFDLDDFKKVNDSYGYHIGDSLLAEAAARFKSVARKGDIACRLSGDEFALLLSHVDEMDQALHIAEKLLDRFRLPINVETLRFYVSTSIGIAYADSPDSNVGEMLRFADIAMYEAKRWGGNRYKIYDKKMSQQALDKVALEDEAREALINNNFSYALQPQIELATGKLIGFEALLRWVHPERGFVSPGHFIPILENSEFMISLGHWCVDRAFTILQQFKQNGFGDLKIAINLAGIQFLDPDLIPLLEEKVASTGLPPELIELELTERTLVSDIQRTSTIMQSLVSKGFVISIDDFGTGYSSLSYLKTMPAHFIKIDRAFVDGMLTNKADKQIVASIIAMVQKLNMRVIAEGIEEQQQIDILKEMDCNLAQGFYIAKPIPEALLFDELEAHCKNGIWHYGDQPRLIP